MNRSLISRVLLVEDNAGHQLLLLRALRSGCPDLDVTVVDTGAEFLRIFKQQEFDCVVMDYNLPDYKAPDLLELAHDFFEKCPAVVVSSSENQEVVIETVRHGAVDFVPKKRAIKGDELWSRIEATLQRFADVASERRDAERRERHLAYLAETDPLTGLNNRHFLDRCFKTGRWSNDRRRYLGCVMADLDHFKKINDTFGHKAGDEALKAVASTMKQAVGNDGAAVRWGGEELVAVCAADGIVKLWSWAEQLRMRIESLMIECGSKRFHVTTSIGVVLTDRTKFDPSVIEQADQSMYLAKSWGRNQVCTVEMAQIAKMLEEINPDGNTPVETVRLQFLAQINHMLGPTQFKHVTGHCERVRYMATRIANEMELPDQTVKDIALAGLLHDIGKVMIPEKLLAKPRSLAMSEWRWMSRHCAYSEWIARQMGASDNVADYCRDHHGWYESESILHNEVGHKPRASQGARILCVADALVTMLSDRSYRAAMPFEAALYELRREQGRQFDPRVVDSAQRIGKRPLPVAA